MKATPQAFAAWAGVLVPAVAGASWAAGIGHPLATVAASFVLVSLLGALAWIDAMSETVPDGLTFPLILLGLFHALIVGLPVLAAAALAGLLVAAAVTQDWLLAGRGWIGSGDYLLFAGAVAWLGIAALPDVIMITAILLGLHAIFARRNTLAVAPSLAITVVVLWFGELLL